MEQPPRIVVAASWRESSISALSRSALGRGQLTERYVVDDRFVAPLALLAGGFGAGGRAHAARARQRCAARSLAADVSMGRLPELLRVAGAKAGDHAPLGLGHERWKVDFDRRAARRLRRLDLTDPLGPADLVIGMPGSSAATFAAAPRATRVLDAIDSHPREHNRLLAEAHPDGRAAAEVHPVWLVRRMEREIELADLVVVPSRLAADGMRRHGVPEHKLAIHPYAVSLVDVDGVDGAETGRAEGRRPSVLCVAQVSYRKGIPQLLEAARRAPGVDVRVAGPAFDPSVVVGAPANVTFLGTLEPAALAEEYAAADAFCLPSLDDCFGLAVTEAASAGLPLLVSARTGAVEVVGDLPQTTVVDPLDPARTGLVLAGVDRLAGEDRALNARRFRAVGRAPLSWEVWADAVLDDAAALHTGVPAVTPARAS